MLSRFSSFCRHTLHTAADCKHPSDTKLKKLGTPGCFGTIAAYRSHPRHTFLPITQIDKVRERGLTADRESLKITFRRMSYYRFSGYLWWFYEDDSWEVIKKGTTLEEVLNLYAFDATLRAHVMRLAHSIEVWLRAALTNRLAEKYGVKAQWVI